MSELDQVSTAIGGLTATAEQQTAQLGEIFSKMNQMHTHMMERNGTTASRLQELENHRDEMKKDIEALTRAITALSKAITDAKLKGWRMIAMFFAIAAVGGGGSATAVSLLKGVLF